MRPVLDMWPVKKNGGSWEPPALASFTSLSLQLISIPCCTSHHSYHESPLYRKDISNSAAVKGWFIPQSNCLKMWCKQGNSIQILWETSPGTGQEQRRMTCYSQCSDQVLNCPKNLNWWIRNSFQHCQLSLIKCFNLSIMSNCSKNLEVSWISLKN